MHSTKTHRVFVVIFNIRVLFSTSFVKRKQNARLQILPLSAFIREFSIYLKEHLK